MKSFTFLATALLAVICHTGVYAHPEETPHTPEKHKTDIPPSAVLSYTVNAKQSGISLGGNTTVNWDTTDSKFTLSTETRAMMLGKIIDARSEGAITSHGLAPETFREKRMRKEETVATFDREAKVVRFNGSDKSVPLSGGEQDRNTVLWQVIAIARAEPEKFKPGSEVRFFVVGKDVDPWIFKIVKHDKTTTPLGEMQTLHVLKTTESGRKEQQVDIWLAPSLEWYPVRLRYTDPDGDYIEQVLTSVTRPTE
jgi:hypothetical protein